MKKLKDFIICPKCKKEIKHLIEQREEINTYNATPKIYKNGIDYTDYVFVDFTDIKESNYFCPECDYMFNDTIENVWANNQK